MVVSGRELHRGMDWIPRALERLKGPVYVTFDIDFFDGSLVPGTGTPEPGGGTYEQALEILRSVSSARKIVGADLVEHAPLPGNRAPDFLAAKLAYKILGYAL
jgi:N1-aminopropylagmatine ureohydrolase